jgi:hypothetical protein
VGRDAQGAWHQARLQGMVVVLTAPPPAPQYRAKTRGSEREGGATEAPPSAARHRDAAPAVEACAGGCGSLGRQGVHQTAHSGQDGGVAHEARGGGGGGGARPGSPSLHYVSAMDMTTEVRLRLSPSRALSVWLLHLMCGGRCKGLAVLRLACVFACPVLVACRLAPCLPPLLPPACR